jgi:hypothetical protein
MPSTVAVEKDQPAWLEFQILDENGDPIVLVEHDQVYVYYKKFGSLYFTQKTPLIPVPDSHNPQTGENFVEIGFGVYAVLFTATDLNTAETFTWVVIPSNPGSLSFKHWVQQIDVVPNTDVTDTVDDIYDQVQTTNEEVVTGFDLTEVDLSAIQTSLGDVTDKINVIQATVEDIQSSIPSGINVSFID